MTDDQEPQLGWWRVEVQLLRLGSHRFGSGDVLRLEALFQQRSLNSCGARVSNLQYSDGRGGIVFDAYANGASPGSAADAVLSVVWDAIEAARIPDLQVETDEVRLSAYRPDG